MLYYLNNIAYIWAGTRFFHRLWLLRGSYYKRIYAQSQRQSLPGVQFHQGLQNLGVYMFRRLIRSDIFLSENTAYANHAAPKLVVAIGFCRHVCPLSRLELRNVAFVHIEPDA